MNSSADGPFRLELLRGISPEREARERALAAAGRALPLPQRQAWAASQPALRGWLLLLHSPAGDSWGVGVQVARSRALPGHLLLRCERFGPGLPPEIQKAALRALTGLADRDRRVLRLYVESFAADEVERASQAAAFAALGYSRLEPPRCYQHTIIVDLEPTEEQIFAGLHATARRHIRSAAKHPVELREISDPRDFPRMDALFRETYARTGGEYQRQPWAGVVELCRRDPAGSRLVGLYRTDREGPDALLAFAWGCGHGDHIHYSKAASTRETDLRIPLAYPLIWDLIRWAKAHDARYFDFGGITRGSHETDDPLGGISDFKRYFSRQVAEVGAEWAYEPRAMQARAAQLLSAASSWMNRLASRAR